MDPVKRQQPVSEHEKNGDEVVSEESHRSDDTVIEHESQERKITAAMVLKTLPSDVTMVIQDTSYTLKTLQVYKGLISHEMRLILQREGYQSRNFRRYGEILRTLTTAIKLKTDFIQKLFQKLTNIPPENIAEMAYPTVLYYQKSLLDYQGVIIQRQKQLNKELRILQNILTKIDETFIVFQRRAEQISQSLVSMTVEDIASYPPQELEKFRTILKGSLNGDPTSEKLQDTWRQSLIKVLEAIAIQALRVKETQKYQEMLNDIETSLATQKAEYVANILTRFSMMSSKAIARKYDAILIKHHLLLLFHLTLLLESQDDLQIIEQNNETTKRISEALNIKLNPYKEQLGQRICDELTEFQAHELAAYQTYEGIQKYRVQLESSIDASEDGEESSELMLRRTTLVKVLEAEGIQILMGDDPEKHKRYQDLLGSIEQRLVPIKRGFLKKRLAHFSGLTAEDIAQKYRVNTIKHNVLLLTRLSLLLNIHEDTDLMFNYYTVSKMIFDALNLKLEEEKARQQEVDTLRPEVKSVLFNSHLFRTLSTNAITRIADQLELIEYPKGTVILKKGQKGDSFYVIKAGSVKVSLPRKGGNEIQLTILGESESFGEISLLTGNPESATITSLGDVQLLRLREEHFNALLIEYPALNRYFHRLLSQRLHSTGTKTKVKIHTKGLAGKLSTISQAELIQTLYTANKTGILTIDDNGNKGKIFIKNGLVIHAITKNLEGEQAFFQIMTWHDGSFRFMPGDVNVERTVTMNVHGLLLEAMKRIDDMRHIQNL